jgi:hypothetical protein
MVLSLCILGFLVIETAEGRGLEKSDLDVMCAKSASKTKPGVQFDGKRADAAVMAFRPGVYGYPEQGGLILFENSHYFLKLPKNTSTVHGTDGDDLLAGGIVGGCSKEQLSEAMQNNNMQAAFFRPVKEKSKASPSLPASSGMTNDHKVIQSLSSEDMVKLLKETGFLGAKVDKDGDVSVKMRGYNVWFLTGKRASVLQAKFGLKNSHANIQKINSWNRTRRFSSAYMDENGNAVLKSDIDLEEGVTTASIKKFITVFYASQGAFIEEVAH